MIDAYLATVAALRDDPDAIDEARREFADRVDWEYLSVNAQNITDELLMEFAAYIDWRELIDCRPISEELMRFLDSRYVMVNAMYNGEGFYYHNELSDEFVAEKASLINWSLYSQWQALTPSKLIQFGHLLNWTLICEQRELSIDFIRRYQAQIVMTDRVAKTIQNDHALMALRFPMEIETLARAYM